ncbi:MAG: hypothetical protein R2832_11890 [Rhodothermales bacterium]
MHVRGSDWDPAPAGAIAIVSPDTFAVKMGSQIPMTGEISAEVPSVSAVTLTDSSRAVLSAFGETYDIGGHWMLDRELIRNATIDYDASSASYLTQRPKDSRSYMRSTQMAH